MELCSFAKGNDDFLHSDNVSKHWKFTIENASAWLLIIRWWYQQQQKRLLSEKYSMHNLSSVWSK